MAICIQRSHTGDIFLLGTSLGALKIKKCIRKVSYDKNHIFSWSFGTLGALKTNMGRGNVFFAGCPESFFPLFFFFDGPKLQALRWVHHTIDALVGSLNASPRLLL
jgi:hypothetical protein